MLESTLGLSACMAGACRLKAQPVLLAERA
jgi:hypothetical protein